MSTPMVLRQWCAHLEIPFFFFSPLSKSQRAPMSFLLYSIFLLDFRISSINNNVVPKRILLGSASAGAGEISFVGLSPIQRAIRLVSQSGSTQKINLDFILPFFLFWLWKTVIIDNYKQNEMKVHQQHLRTSSNGPTILSDKPELNLCGP